MTVGKVVTFTDKNYLENEFIDLASAPNDEYLRGDGTWQTASYIVGSGLTMAAMDDVNLTSTSDGDLLTYDSATSKWVNEQGSNLASSIGLGTTSNPTFNQLTLTGNLTVQGVTTTVDSTTMTVVDPIITLQTASGGGALPSDSNKDVGLAMQYHTGSAAKTAFLGYDDSEGKLTFIPDATITSEVTSGTKGTIVANLEGNADTVTNGLYTTDLGVTVQSYDAELAAIAGLTSAANKGIQFTGSGTASTYDLTAAGKALLDDPDVATQRLTLGLGSIATHSLSSVLALMQQKIPQINARTQKILKTGLGTAANYDLSSLLGLLGEPRLPSYVSSTTRDILKSGLGTISTHSLSSVLAMMSTQVPSYLQHLDSASVSILKSGLGSIATHSLSSVYSMMSSTVSISGLKDIDITAVADNDILVHNGVRWVNESPATARLSLGLGSIATRSLSSVLALMSTQVPSYLQHLDSASVSILKSGLGSIATHSLSSVLAMTNNQNSYGDKTEKILKKGLGTIASKDFATVMMAFDHNTTLKNLQDTVIDSATVADNDFLIFNSSDAKWYNRDAATSRTKMGLGTIATKSLAAVLAMTQASGSAAAGTSTTSTELIYILLEAGGGLGGQQLENEADTDNTNFILMPNVSDTFNAFWLTLQDIGVQIQAYDPTILVDADIGSTVQAHDAALDSLATVSSADGNFIVGAGIGGWVAESGATARASLGLGSIATHSLSSVISMVSMSAKKGLTIGTDVQAYDPELNALAGTTSAADKGIYYTGSGTASTFDLTSAGRSFLASANYNDMLAYLTLSPNHSPWFMTIRCTSTGSITIPSGTTAQQGTPVQGGMRYNTDDSAFEGYDGAAWSGLGGGGAANQVSDADSSTADVSGTYTETMMIADTFSVNGTVTLTAGFYMSKITDDGNPVIVTGSGTLTGTGTMASRFPFAADNPKANRKNLGLGHQGDGIATRSLASAMLLTPTWGKAKQATDFVSKASGGTFDGDIGIGESSPDSRLEVNNKIKVSSDTTNPLFDLDNQTTNGKNWRMQGESGDGAFTFKNATDNITAYQINTAGEFLGIDVSGHIMPSVNTTYNLGSASYKFNNMYATTFNGNATSANWVDLAERYGADDHYDEGTVLAIGGEKEVTEYKKGMPFAGVVSIYPGLRMNDRLEYENPGLNFPYVCLKGRIPVKINGEARKGDYIVADDNGKGKSIGNQWPDMHNLIGISLEDGVDIIEVKV